MPNRTPRKVGSAKKARHEAWLKVEKARSEARIVATLRVHEAANKKG